MKNVLIETKTQRFRGIEEKDVIAFKGVPYAKAPVGDLRFRAPQPLDPSDEVVDCLEWAPDCPQIARFDRQPNPNRPAPVPSKTSEDCLRMNILVPGGFDKKLPVFVWLHGGDRLNLGGIPSVDGTAFIRKGIVFITPVWRCGVMGCLGIEEFREREPHGSTGAYGILDIIACLEWVKDNIASFGGDPDNVTIGGQSSGAMTVKGLICAPPARGLFHRAIAMSGGGIWDVDGCISFEQKNELCHICMENAGISVNDLLTADAEELGLKLGKAMSEMEFEQTSLSKMFFKPSVDNYVLFSDYGRELNDGLGHDIDIMCGTIREEWNNFVHQVPGGIDGYNHEFALGAAITWAERNLELGKKPVYHYYFDHDLPGEDPAPRHGSEMQYVFGMLDPYKRPWTQYDYLIENTCVDYWTSFIKTGNPNINGAPQWVPYDNPGKLSMHVRNDGMVCENLSNDKKTLEAVRFMLDRPGVLHDSFFNR